MSRPGRSGDRWRGASRREPRSVGGRVHGFLAAGHRGGGGGPRHDPGPPGRALRRAARHRDALARGPLRTAGSAVPGLRPGDRVHRRRADALPLRADDRGGERG